MCRCSNKDFSRCGGEIACREIYFSGKNNVHKKKQRGETCLRFCMNMCEWRRCFKCKFDVILHYILLVSAKVFLSLLLGEVFILFHIFYLSIIYVLSFAQKKLYMVTLFFFCFYTVWPIYCRHHCLSLPGCTKIPPEMENKVWLVGILQLKLCLTLGRGVGHDKRWNSCITNKPLNIFFPDIY